MHVMSLGFQGTGAPCISKSKTLLTTLHVVHGSLHTVCWPAQGIELSNPTPHNLDAIKSGTESYFSEYSGFRSLKAQPPKQL